MEEFTSLLATHGLLIVAIGVLVDQLGIPIPAPPVLILAGGLIGTGELVAGPTLAVATLASLPAGFTWFEIGRRRGRGVLRLLCRISLEPDSCVRSTSGSMSSTRDIKKSREIEKSSSTALDRTKPRAPVWRSS